MASPRESPDSEVPSNVILGTLSIRDKSLLKRNINKHHNNNFSAGYVPVHEEDLHKTGLRGAKLYVFWTVLAVLSVVALVNLIVLLIMLSVLRIGLGMQSLELMPDHSLLKFHGRTDFGNIRKEDGIIEGFRNEPLLIIGDESQLAIDILTPELEEAVRVMSMDENLLLFQRMKSFQVKHPQNNKIIFSTRNPSITLRKGIRDLQVNYATTAKVSSPVNVDLDLRSESYIRFRGNEGTEIEGESVLLSSDQYLFLKSVNGSVVFNSTEGVFVDMAEMPEAACSTSGLPYIGQFKVCVCVPSGKLFRVAVHTGESSDDACDWPDGEQDVDPCDTSSASRNEL